MIKFQQNYLSEVVEYFALRSINLLFLFSTRRNFLKSGRIQSLYLFIRREIKQIIIIGVAYHFAKYIQNFIQHPAVKVNSHCRGI
jgi:hypothetical protein